MRELIGLWIVRLGKKIVWLGDEIGGWGHSNPFSLGLRMGVREGREQGLKQARKNLPEEW